MSWFWELVENEVGTFSLGTSVPPRKLEHTNTRAHRPICTITSPSCAHPHDPYPTMLA